MIYLDNAATTKPDVECLEKAKKYLCELYYNPSALYAEGYELQSDIKTARHNILNLIADDINYDIVFTSCGTEADNYALFSGCRRGNLVISAGEHSAVYESAMELKRRGIEVRIAQLNSNGSVNEENLLSLIDDKTSLVSIIHVNNETGAINDVNSFATKIKEINKRVLFHTDGVQSFGKIPYKIGDDVDLYSLSAHKIGGLKGVGALIKKKNVKIRPFICGGGQEGGQRSGTENLFGIKVLEFCAQKKYANIKVEYDRIATLKEILIESLDKSLFKVISSGNSSPYVVSISALGVRGETIMHELDDLGVIVGTGSACSSNSKKRYSRTILACGVEHLLADGILRISFSSDTSENDVKDACKILNKVVKERRERML